MRPMKGILVNITAISAEKVTPINVFIAPKIKKAIGELFAPPKSSVIILAIFIGPIETFSGLVR